MTPQEASSPPVAPGAPMAFVEEWPAARFRAELNARERALVLFDADWCPFARRFRPLFEAAEPDAIVPLVRAALSPSDRRWSEFGIDVVPTLVYYEHGEELERIDGVEGIGLSRADLDEMMETISAIQEEPVLPKWMHGPRRG